MKKIEIRPKGLLNAASEHLSYRFIAALVVLIALLVFVNAALFVENLRFKQSNRQLILQNDSLFSSSPKIKSTIDTLKKKKLRT